MSADASGELVGMSNEQLSAKLEWIAGEDVMAAKALDVEDRASRFFLEAARRLRAIRPVAPKTRQFIVDFIGWVDQPVDAQVGNLIKLKERAWDLLRATPPALPSSGLDKESVRIELASAMGISSRSEHAEWAKLDRAVDAVMSLNNPVPTGAGEPAKMSTPTQPAPDWADRAAEAIDEANYEAFLARGTTATGDKLAALIRDLGPEDLCAKLAAAEGRCRALESALREIASQLLTTEMDNEEEDLADFPGAYDAAVMEARDALAGAGKTEGAEMDQRAGAFDLKQAERIRELEARLAKAESVEAYGKAEGK